MVSNDSKRCPVETLPSALSWRAFIIGLASALLTAVASPWLEGGAPPADYILPQMPLAIFVVVILVNMILLRLGRRGFNRGELLVIFIIGFVGGSVCRRVPQVLGYVATPEGETKGDRWDEYAKPLIPSSFYLRDHEVARGYFTGRLPAFGSELETHRTTIRTIQERLVARRRKTGSGEGAAQLSRYEMAELEQSKLKVTELEPVVNRAIEIEGRMAPLEARLKEISSEQDSIEKRLKNIRKASKLSASETDRLQKEKTTIAVKKSKLIAERKEIQSQLAELHNDYESKVGSYWRGRVWLAWLPPLTAWAILIGGLVVFGIGYTTLIRKQWMENERIVTPLIEIPMVLMGEKEGESVFGNRVFLLGFFIGLIYVLWNTVPSLYRGWPEFTLQHAAWEHVFGGKYSAPPNPIIIFRIFVPVLALSFFIRRDVLFSIVFFRVVSAFGSRYLAHTSNFFSPEYQFEGNGYNCNTNWIAMGAFLGFGLVTLLMSRRFLLSVGKHITFSKQADLDDEAEFLPYRISAALIVVGLGAFYWSLLRFNIRPDLAALFCAAVALMIISGTRLVLETGLIFFRTPVSVVDGLLYAVRSTFSETWTSVGGIASGHVYLSDIKNFTAQALGHANKVAGRLPVGKSRRRLGFILFLVLVLSTLVCVSSHLVKAYAVGESGWHSVSLPRIAFDDTVKTLTRAGVPPVKLDEGETPETVAASEAFELARQDMKVSSIDSRRGWRLLGGFIGVIMVWLMRVYMVWWPIHPIGLVLCQSDAAAHAFFSVFFAWLIKFITLRVGGVGALRKVSPCFVGLLAGFALGVGISWLVWLGAGLYDCAAVNSWTWDVFLQRKTVNLYGF